MPVSPVPGGPYTPPRWPVIRWLTAPASAVPADIRARLLTGFFESVVPLISGGLASLSVNAAAAFRHPEPLFMALLVLDALLFGIRTTLMARSRRAAAAGLRTPTDLFFASNLVWTGLVGAWTFACFASGDHLLQVIAPLTMMGILTGIVTRNNAAPRLTILQVALCIGPLALAMLLTGDPWLLVVVAQAPLLMVSVVSTVYRLNRGYLAVAVAQRESEQRAATDALTGLRNRSGLMAALSRALRRPEDRLALLYLDLDGFKAVNDRLGHAAGDRLLREAAARASALIADDGVAARLGGDEFVILAPGRDAAEAVLLAEAVIAAVGRPYDLGVEVRVGTSIGIALAAPRTAPEILIARADAALYRAKAAGKGRWWLADAPEPARRAA
ncbi:GGDEF domain-containing protein [Methylobacterium sp. NEAU 140]|uniref:GGDEF domain-containing protein n=1 Tax=Methylobacterium sp. NEAU 140 TaxID=3064945 RepID=UPI0027326B6F|nr:GGDEF domain-containing protein [Methylobacterium sp. NEAU 140]MDP4024419.1 GGDEF domain-containing protein [Methylobacterium sp. NEAU 140]